MKQFGRKFAWLLIVPALLGLAVSSQTVSAAAEILPRADFPICSPDRMIYCISEVTFIELTGEKPGTWVPNGTSATGSVFPTFEKVSYAGRFSYDGFDVTRGYDGVYVRVGPANEYTDRKSSGQGKYLLPVVNTPVLLERNGGSWTVL